MPKPKPDPHAPKGAMSSYFQYLNARRPILKQQMPNQPSIVLQRAIAAEWKNLTEDQRKIYNELAKQDKNRYIAEFEKYRLTENYREHQRAIQKWKAEEGITNKSSSSKRKRGPKPQKPIEPATLPKKPLSSYFLFSNERRSELQAQYPDKNILDIAKMMGLEWKSKDESEKKVYKDRFDRLKAQYLSDLEAFKGKEEAKRYFAELEEYKAAKKVYDQQQDDDNDVQVVPVKLPRKPKDPQCPKKPLTSYFLFAKKVREETRSQFPQKPVTEIAKVIGRQWKAMSEDQKTPYQEDAKRLKASYEESMKEYVGSDAQKEYELKLEQWRKECDERRAAARNKRLRQLAKEEENTRSAVAKAMKSRHGRNGYKSHSSRDRKTRKRRYDSESSSDESSSGYTSSSSSGSSSSGTYSSSDSSSDSESSSSRY